MTPRNALIAATGNTTGVKITPPNLALGPMQRAAAVVSLTIGVDQPFGEERDLLIWVRGCREHFLRWTITVASKGIDACQEVEVDDGPDLIHHWYDHFYCNRSCQRGS